MLKLKDGYYVKDKDGTIYAYKEKPIKFNIVWDSDSQIDQVNSVEITEPWEDSLYHVKEGVATKVVTFVKDQKVLVRDCEQRKWTKRYYSHESNGRHYVFVNGQTSWTKPDMANFKYIKPYIEGEDE